MPDQPLTADQISALRAAVERIAANPDFGYTDATLTWGFWDDVRTVTDVAPALLSLAEEAARLKEIADTSAAHLELLRRQLRPYNATIYDEIRVTLYAEAHRLQPSVHDDLPKRSPGGARTPAE